MIRSSKKSNILLMMFSLLMASCNQGNNGDTPVTSSEDTVSKVSSDPQAEQIIGGKLDTLWIDSLGFDTIPKKKMVFSFTFGQLDTLTIHGWTLRGTMGREFNDPPNLKLLKGRASGFSYGPGTYFGNLILTKEHIENIKQVLIDSAGKFVLFAPQKSGENISYKISISRDHPTLVTKIHLTIPTDGIANPSPPKNR